MSLTTPSKLYQATIDDVQKNRAAANGQRAIKNGTTKYLFPLASMLNGGGDLTKEGQESYNKYLKLALYLNAVGRTIDGYSGLIFRKVPIIEVPENLEYIKTNVNAANETLINQMQSTVREAFITPSCALLTDFPKSEGQVSTATAEAMNLRPNIVLFPYESIISKFYTTIDNQYKLALAVIKEVTQELKEFVIEDVIQYRVLSLQGGIYHGGLYSEAGEVISEPEPILVNGSTSDEIPMFFIEPLDGVKSFIDDLVDVNLNHYNMFASYANKEHSSGFPIFWETGVLDPENDNNVKIGPGAKWVSQNSEAEFGVLETSGDGGSLRQYLEDRKQEMAALGAEALQTKTNQAESGESKRLDKVAQNATVADVANTVSRAYQQALEFADKWQGGSNEITVKLNTDYIPDDMNPQLLTALLASLQTGQISYETFWTNLQKGEIAPTSRDADEERALINQQDTGFTDE